LEGKLEEKLYSMGIDISTIAEKFDISKTEVLNFLKD